MGDCGTMRGVYLHRKANEDPCELCRQARNAYQRENYTQRKQKCKRGHDLVTTVGGRRRCVECHVLDERACGTVAGAAQHKRHGERPCDPCRVALNAYERSLRPKTHCQCGREYRHVDSRGRKYCPDCRSKYGKKVVWLGEARSLRSLSYTDKEIATQLGIDLDTLQLRLRGDYAV